MPPFWAPVLEHSVGGLVGLTAVRANADGTGPIINFRYLFLNAVARRDTLGNRPDANPAIEGALFTDYFPDITTSDLWPTYIDVVERGQPRRLEQHYQLDDRDVHITQSVSAFGVDGLLLTYTEPSDLQQMTRRLANQTILLNSVLNSSPNGILVFEAVRDRQQHITNFQITLTNRQFIDLTGCVDTPFIGQLVTDIYPLTPERFATLRQLVESGGSVQFDEYIGPINRWLSISLTTLNDGFVATVQDITADRQMRTQLEKTVQELHRSNQSLEQFAYIASHDLQEPLRKILSFGDILTNQYASELTDSATDIVRRMQHAASRMQTLISDLLGYARVSGSSVAFAPVDLNRLLAQIIDDLEMAIEDRRAIVRVGNLPTITGDARLLQQLFQNLMSNALKFQPTHLASHIPCIEISGQEISSAELPETVAASLNPQPYKRYALLTVADNGIGFDEQYLDRIFTIFQRLHGRSHYTGTGMGLAICRKVADIHGGMITATSADGQGATFSLYMPC